MTPKEHEVRQFRQKRAFESLYSSQAPKTVLSGRWELHDFAAEHVGPTEEVTYLEFGVFDGKSIARWAKNLSNSATTLAGFDSFVGLPESWDVGFAQFQKGTFSTNGEPPVFDDSRITFLKGWFQNTLPGFLKSKAASFHPRVVVHLDADLYPSTLFILASLWDFIPEYYFIMDDFLQDDVIALHDFTMAFPVKIEWLAVNSAANGLPLQVFGRLERIPMKVEG